MQRCMYYIAVLIFAASCKQVKTESLTGADGTALATEIKQTLVHCNDDIREHGLLAEFPYLDSSSQFFWVPPGYTSALSYDSVAKIIRANAAGIKKMDNSWDTLQVNMLSDNIASYTGKVRSEVTDTSGKVFNGVLIESGTLIKRKDGWKLLCGQTAVLANQ